MEVSSPKTERKLRAWCSFPSVFGVDTSINPKNITMIPEIIIPWWSSRLKWRLVHLPCNGCSAWFYDIPAWCGIHLSIGWLVPLAAEHHIQKYFSYIWLDGLLLAMGRRNPREDPGVKSRIRPPYPQRVVKGD